MSEPQNEERLLEGYRALLRAKEPDGKKILMSRRNVSDIVLS
jgi:hypothetical protein